MKRLPLILLIAGVAILGISCKSRKVNKADKFYLEISKTPCFGKCPIYTMSVNIEGDLSLYAKRFMTLEGHYTASLNKDSLVLLTEQIKYINWTELESEYLTGYSDLPATEVKYSENPGDTTFVRWESNRAPQQVLSLSSRLEVVQQSTNWKSIDLD